MFKSSLALTRKDRDFRQNMGKTRDCTRHIPEQPSKRRHTPALELCIPALQRPACRTTCKCAHAQAHSIHPVRANVPTRKRIQITPSVQMCPCASAFKSPRPCKCAHAQAHSIHPVRANVCPRASAFNSVVVSRGPHAQPIPAALQAISRRHTPAL